jgi:hypothetical protein
MVEMREGTPVGVLFRDLFIFQIKLVLDGFKDAAVIPLSVVAVAIDLFVGGGRRGRVFYSLMHAGERFDRWLNLHGAARRAMYNRDGLFGESRAGDDTFLGELEHAVRGPEGVHHAGPVPARPGLPGGG